MVLANILKWTLYFARFILINADFHLTVLLYPYSSQGNAGGRSALFAEINRGEAVTSGLRKVTDDMKTHKNPALRAPSDTPIKPPKPTQNQIPRQNQSTPQKGVLELRGNKWVVVSLLPFYHCLGGISGPVFSSK